MQVSTPELKAMVKRVLEACRFPEGDYEDVSTILSWSEACGLKGISFLKEQFDTIKNEQKLSISELYDGENVTVYNCQSKSALLTCTVALDFAYVKAAQYGIGTVEFYNSKEAADYLLYQAVRGAKKGVHTIVTWRELDKGSNKLFKYTAIGQIEDNFPTLIKEAVTLPEGKLQQLDVFSITCIHSSSHVDLLSSHITTNDNATIIQPKQLEDNWKTAVTDGMAVDKEIWNYFAEIGKAVLVETSERSRLQGAGETAN
jgi:hypothetical protein